VIVANLINPGQEHLQPAASSVGPGVEVADVLTKANVPMPLNRVDTALKDLVYVEAGMRAQSLGASAVFVNTVGDYAVEVLREALSIPVVGAGEASVQAAMRLERQFSIVSIWPSKAAPVFERVVADNNAEYRCASIRFVLDEPDVDAFGGRAGVMAAAAAGDSDILERIIRSCRAAIEEDGAQAIILGCTCMAATADVVRGTLGVPVIEPMHEGWLRAEAAAVGASDVKIPDPAFSLGLVETAVEAMSHSSDVLVQDDCEGACAFVPGSRGKAHLETTPA